MAALRYVLFCSILWQTNVYVDSCKNKTKTRKIISYTNILEYFRLN